MASIRGFKKSPEKMNPDPYSKDIPKINVIYGILRYNSDPKFLKSESGIPEKDSCRSACCSRIKKNWEKIKVLRMKILTNFFQFCVKKYSHDLKWQGRAGFFYRNLSSRPNLSHSGYQKSTLIRKIYFLQKPFKKLQLCFCLFKLFSRFQRSIKFKTEMSKIKIFKPF